MRTLLADGNSERLEAMALALSDAFTVDLATTKTQCIDLLRPERYEVLVACEQLEDGSGLELLSQAEDRWPTVLRVFAADPSRLELLKGKLGPFKLYRTLAYPLDPAELRSVLNEAERRDGVPPVRLRRRARRVTR